MNRVDFSKALTVIKYPQKVAVAFVKIDDGKFNAITLEWFMRTSIDPPMFAISVGHTRFSHQCLQDHRMFNLCFPALEHKGFVVTSGSKSGREIDKMAEIEGQWFKGRYAGLPVLKNAAACFECDLISQISSGDHTIFIGKVKYSWIGDDKAPFTLRDFKFK